MADLRHPPTVSVPVVDRSAEQAVAGAKSALLIPVPAAESVVGRWRRAHDPAAAGVPAHVSLIVPWLEPQTIDRSALEDLAAMVKATPAWDFELSDVAWFGSRVLWLSPRPAEPFEALIATLAERWGTPPWAGEFDEVVPHLTVAHAAGDDAALRDVERTLRRCLPIACRAEEVWAMVGDGRTWSVRATCPLG